MNLIGITGKIGSGKSSASQYLKEKGFKIIDCDEICHDLLDIHEISQDILTMFGELVINKDRNGFDKTKLRKLILNNNDAKKIYEDYMHPLIFNEVNFLLEKYKDEDNVVIDAPLLFETKMYNKYNFDKIIYIHTKFSIRKKRAINRGVEKIDFLSFDKNQFLFEFIKTQKIKNLIVIENNDTISILKSNIDKIISSEKEIIKKEEKQLKKAIIAGSFDPFHYGHKQLIDETIDLYDQLYIVIAINKDKKGFLPVEQRKNILESFIRSQYPNKNIIVDIYDGLLMDYMKNNQIEYYIRGLRNNNDLIYEQTMYYTNKALYPSLKMHYIISDKKYLNVSSSIIRELIQYGKKIDLYTPIEII